MIARRARRPRFARVAIAAAVVLLVAIVTALAVRAVLDRREYVSPFQLDAAMKTFRPEPNAGLAKPLAADSFSPDRNPRTVPDACAPLTALATGQALDGRSWTGAGVGSQAPVTLLTVRFDDAGAARAELNRKRLAMLRCGEVVITFPPFDRPATSYRVDGRDWLTSAMGRQLHWSLDGGGRHFDFYVVRFGNTLTWTYADDASTPQSREKTADGLVQRLAEVVDS